MTNPDWKWTEIQLCIISSSLTIDISQANTHCRPWVKSTPAVSFPYIYIYIKVMNWWERCVILQNWSVKPTIVTINATTALGLQASLDDSLGTPWGTGDLRHKLQKCDCAVAKLEMSFQLKINEMHLYTCKQISSATVKHQSSKLNTNPRIQQKNDISCAETICFELFRFRQAGTRDAEGNMNKICFAWNGQAWKC